MKIGLDLGATEFRSVTIDQGRLIARRVRTDYVVLPRSAAHQSLLEHLRVAQIPCESHFLVVGHAAELISQIAQVPMIPLLPDGRLAEGDSVSRQLCDILLDQVLPGPYSSNMTVCTALPWAGIVAARPTHRFLLQLLLRRFRNVEVLHPATGLILAEGESQGFTALGIVFGATSTSWSLCRHGQEIVNHTIPGGSRLIHAGLSHDRGQFSWDVTGNKLIDLQWGEQLQSDPAFDLVRPVTLEQHQLAQGYVQLLSRVVRTLQSEIKRSVRNEFGNGRMALLVGGGPSQIPGLETLILRCLAEVKLRGRFSEIHFTKPNPFSIARGALVGGESQRQARSA